MATALNEFQVWFYPSGVSPYLEARNWDNPNQANTVCVESLSLSNARLGGCRGATIDLVASNPDYLTDTLWSHLVPPCGVCIKVKATGDSVKHNRYHGVLTKLDRSATDPHRIKVTCRGAFDDQLAACMAMLYLDNVTVKAAVQAIVAKVAHCSQLSAMTTYVTYDPSYTIDQIDWPMVKLARALKLMAEVAGPSAIYGVKPVPDGAPIVSHFLGYVYFAEMSAVALDMGFEVGSSRTVESATSSEDATRILNAGYVTCQRKIGGGTLTLHVPGPAGETWKWLKLSVPEVVEPADAYRFAEKFLEAREDLDERVNFSAPNFGRQVWANEIMNAPLKIALSEGGADVEVWPDSYTLSLHPNGSVDTKFKLGKRPEMSMATEFGDLMRDIIVAKHQDLWSGAELADMNRDDARTWRRHAGANHDIMNFWQAANLGNLDSVLTAEQAGDAGLSEPGVWPDWGWEREGARDVLVRNTSADGSVLSCFIPTGRTPSAAAVYVANEGRIITCGSSRWQDAWWDYRGEANMFTYLPKGRRVFYDPGGSGLDDGMTYLQDMYDASISENPTTMKVFRPSRSGYATAPTSFAEMAALTGYVDVVWALTTNAESTAKYYCLRLFRTSSTSSLVYVTCGWWEAGSGLVETHWTTGGSPFSSFSVGTDGAVPHPTHPFLRIVCDLPTSHQDDWDITIYQADSATVLWSNSQAVDMGSGNAHDPSGRYIAGMRWDAYAASLGWDTFGIQTLTYSGGNLPIAITRDGSTWVTGSAQALKTLIGGTSWSDGKVGIRIATYMTGKDSLKGWAVGFLTVDEV